MAHEIYEFAIEVLKVKPSLCHNQPNSFLMPSTSTQPKKNIHKYFSLETLKTHTFIPFVDNKSTTSAESRCFFDNFFNFFFRPFLVPSHLFPFSPQFLFLLDTQKKFWIKIKKKLISIWGNLPMNWEVEMFFVADRNKKLGCTNGIEEEMWNLKRANIAKKNLGK